ncbi:hypothetical protein KAR34_04290 [bacterium]|nr:hypothetical protein [bacterium]
MKQKKDIFYFRCALAMLLGYVLVFFGVQTVQAKIYADRENKIYHKETCSEVENINERYLRLFNSEPEAESCGFYPCKKCVPPIGQPSLKSKEIKKLSVPIERKKTYVGDCARKIYHNEWCPLIKDIPAKNRRGFSSAKTAIQQEYMSCKECNPPARFKRNKTKNDILEEMPDEERPPAEMEEAEEENLPEAETE